MKGNGLATALERALARFDEATKRHARAVIAALCSELRIDAGLFSAEELDNAVDAALSWRPRGSTAFAEHLYAECLGALHAKMVHLAREGFVLPTSLDEAGYAALVSELELRFGMIEAQHVGVYLYGVVDPRSGRSFEIELPGRRREPETTIDAGDAPLGRDRDPLRRLREAIAARRIVVNETSGASSRRVPLVVLEEVIAQGAPLEVIGPMAVL